MVAHRWSGWPGEWCLDCGAEDREELALADGKYTEADDGSISISIEYANGPCPEPGRKRHDPYAKKE